MKNILEAGSKQELYEVSLGRIWQHVEGADTKSFAIITSWRQEFSKKKNVKDFNALKSSIRSLGHGFVTVLGHWKECQDPTVAYKDCPEEQLVDATEPSLFVMGLSKEQAQTLASQAQQDAIVYAGPETNGKVNLLFNDGSDQEIGDFKPQTMGQAYSELVRSKKKAVRSFAFEGFEYKVQGFIESLVEQELNKISKKKK
jgi:hypothetical protein